MSREASLYLIPCSDKSCRVYQLEDGDVFTLRDLSLEYEDKMFYEVEPVIEVRFAEHTIPINTVWHRTGRVFNAEELNEYVLEVSGHE